MMKLAGTVFRSVGVFLSFIFKQDLSSVSLLNQDNQKFPSNMKEAWTTNFDPQTHKGPNFFDFDDHMEKKAGGDDQKKKK